MDLVFCHDAKLETSILYILIKEINIFIIQWLIYNFGYIKYFQILFFILFMCNDTIELDLISIALVSIALVSIFIKTYDIQKQWKIWYNPMKNMIQNNEKYDTKQ